jgi:hypothetical protein
MTVTKESLYNLHPHRYVHRFDELEGLLEVLLCESELVFSDCFVV